MSRHAETHDRIELPNNETCERVEAFVREGMASERVAVEPVSDPFWAGLRDLGSELWLETGGELVARLRQAGIEDLFPALSTEEEARIAGDGKIPDHSRWAGRIAGGTAAVDSLLNLAGLASFAADQEALDERIVRIAGL